MARVVLVHGIGQQFEGPELLSLRLVAAARDGVSLSSELTLGAEDVACAFYGNAFIEPGTPAGGLPAWGERDVEEGLEAELLDAWWRRAAEIDDRVPPADEERTRGPLAYAASRPLLSRWVRERLNALAEARFFEPVSKRMLVSELKQVRLYMDEPPIWQAARAAVAAAIRPETRVVVAHSLGLSMIHRRLSPLPVEGRGGWPGSVVRWAGRRKPGCCAAAHPGCRSRSCRGTLGG